MLTSTSILCHWVCGDIWPLTPLMYVYTYSFAFDFNLCFIFSYQILIIKVFCIWREKYWLFLYKSSDLEIYVLSTTVNQLLFITLFWDILVRDDLVFSHFSWSSFNTAKKKQPCRQKFEAFILQEKFTTNNFFKTSWRFSCWFTKIVKKKSCQKQKVLITCWIWSCCVVH